MSCGSAKRAIGIIARDPFYAHTACRYREYNIMNFENINRYQLGNFMYTFANSLLPESLSVARFAKINCIVYIILVSDYAERISRNSDIHNTYILCAMSWMFQQNSVRSSQH